MNTRVRTTQRAAPQFRNRGYRMYRSDDSNVIQSAVNTARRRSQEELAYCKSAIRLDHKFPIISTPALWTRRTTSPSARRPASMTDQHAKNTAKQTMLAPTH